MYHIDILVHLLTLFSGTLASVLGFLLFVKYRIKAIRHYSIFILSTNSTVLLTAFHNYASVNFCINNIISIQIAELLVYELFFLLVNYSYSSFALGITRKKPSKLNKYFFYIPCFLMLMSIITVLFLYISNNEKLIINTLVYYFLVILLFLLLAFILYSVLIMLNMKKITNNDLRKALKILALIFIIYIPVQAFIIIYTQDALFIFMSRNILFLCINVVSIGFAAKYFFINTPSIFDEIPVSASFMAKYSISKKEKEIIELLLSGRSARKIGEKLGRSFKTVDNHVYNIYRKTNTNNKIELLNLLKETQIKS